MQQFGIRALFGAMWVTAFVICGCSGSDRASTGSGSRASTAANLLDDVKHRGTLLITTDGNYKPQSYRNPDGTWVGFDIDVGRVVAKRLGVKPDFRDVNFDLITAGNWNGRFDVNIVSMAITPDRAKVLWFTEPYYFVPAAFAVHRDSKIRSLADLSGKKIGLGTATSYQEYLQGKLAEVGATISPPANVQIVPYDTDLLALQDLALGDGVRLDAVLTARPTINAAVGGGQPFRVIDPTVYSDRSAIAFDKSSPLDSRPLRDAVERIVEQMHRDGTLRRLCLKYYGVDLSVAPAKAPAGPK